MFINLLLTRAEVYTEFRGWGGVPGAMAEVPFYIGEIKNLAFFKLEIFQKFKKSNEKFKIF